jgi:hypothetical protein
MGVVFAEMGRKEEASRALRLPGPGPFKIYGIYRAVPESCTQRR